MQLLIDCLRDDAATPCPRAVGDDDPQCQVEDDARSFEHGQDDPSLRPGDAGILGEFVDLAVRAAEVHPGVAAVVNR